MRAQVATPEAFWILAGGKPAPAGAATGMFPQNIVRTLARVPEESPSVAIMHSRFSRISIVTGVGWGILVAAEGRAVFIEPSPKLAM